ncbi:GntR family transcriptional regulator, partial [Christensenellaceae bacterium OttesenSCG-928-M15]|nr:GntR family transcriptional regulator [Christensenellaceae bacterium OttesenSCG-928-M15]
MSEATLAYRKIVDDILSLIAAGQLLPGDRLPAERALVTQYAVSRGTVKRALEELVRLGALDKRHGSGTFVLDKKQVFPIGGMGVKQVVRQMMDMQLTGSEIAAIFFMETWKRLPESEQVRLLFINNVPELMKMEEHEMQKECGMRVRSLSLGEAIDELENIRGAFDIVATTALCYPALMETARKKGMSIRVEQIVFSPSIEAIRAFVPIDGKAVAVGYKSKAYLKKLQRELLSYCPRAHVKPYRLEEWVLHGRTRREEYLVLPPMEEEEKERWRSGYDGEIIPFTCALDKGSSALLLERGRKCFEEKLLQKLPPQ